MDHNRITVNDQPPSITNSLTPRADNYTNPSQYERELNQVLRNSWQFVCPESSLREVGSYFAAEVLGRPIVVVRARSGQLRGYFNVCQHRGGPLVHNQLPGDNGVVSIAPPKKLRFFQCQYHGWTFDLEAGGLISAPHMDAVEQFSKSCVNLKSIKVDTWQGLVFVHLGEPGPANSLHEYLAGIALPTDTPAQIETLEFDRRISYEIKCNWKIYVENYLEGYHVPFVHPTLNQTLEFSKYETKVFDRYSIQLSPINSDDPIYGEQGAMAHYYFIYPNLMLNILPNRLQINVVEPLSPQTCRVDFYYFYTPEELRRHQEFVKSEQDFSDVVQKEDISICEHLQRAMGSGAFSRGRYCPPFESALFDFHRKLAPITGRETSHS